MAPRAEIQALFDRYAALFVAGDLEGATDCYAEDGLIQSPFGPPAEGRAAILAAHRAWHTAAEVSKTIRVGRLGSDGDLAYCTARYDDAARTADGGLAVESGLSLNVFRRDAAGGWRIVATSLVEIPAGEQEEEGG